MKANDTIAMSDQPAPPTPDTVTTVLPPRSPRRWSHFHTAIGTVLLCTGIGYLLVEHYLPTREWYVRENPDRLSEMKKQEYQFAILSSKLPPAGKIRLFNELSKSGWRDSSDRHYRSAHLGNEEINRYFVRLIHDLLSAEPDSRDGQIDAVRMLQSFAFAGGKWTDDSNGTDERVRNPFARLLDGYISDSKPNIRKYFASQSAEMRAAVLDLYFLRGTSPPKEYLPSLLRDPDPGVRKRAFATVRDSWDPEVRDEQIRAIDDADPELARLAVRSLGASLGGYESSPLENQPRKDTDPVRLALIGLLFTQAELDAVPAEIRANHKWQSNEPFSLAPIPGERRPAKLRAQAVLSLGQMPCSPESVAAILRTLGDPHDEVVCAAAVAALSPKLITDESMWAKIADALLRAMRDRASSASWKHADVDLISFEPAIAILRTLASRPELRGRARDAIPELIACNAHVWGSLYYGESYAPDVASPETMRGRNDFTAPFPRFRQDSPPDNTFQLTRIPEWAGGFGSERMNGSYFQFLMDRIGRANKSDLSALEKLLATADGVTRRETARAIVRTLATADAGPNRFEHIQGPKFHPLVVEAAREYEQAR